jgi:hypothetical protein
MPQAPLPAPAQRLSPQNLITPIIAGTSTPQDVLAHQWNVDMIDKMGKGLQIGQALARLPREGAENVAQKAYAEIAAQQAKAIQAQIKQIQKTTYNPTDPAANLAAQNAEIQKVLTTSGYYYSGGTGGFSGQYPANLLPRATFLGSETDTNRTPATNTPAPAATTNQPVTPAKTVTPAPAPAPVQQKSPLDQIIDRYAPGTGSAVPATGLQTGLAYAPIQEPQQNPYLTNAQGGYLPSASFMVG